MALWTPYAEEALDLTRSMKHERRSPENIHHQCNVNLTNGSVIQQYVCQQKLDDQDWFSKAPSPPQSPELYEIDSLSEDVEYQAFERDALRAMAEKNGGALLGNNPRMRRAVQTTQAADDSYKKQRERNNFAAKQSRDRRKLREVRLAFQVTFLKNKLTALRAKLTDKVCSRCKAQ